MSTKFRANPLFEPLLVCVPQLGPRPQLGNVPSDTVYHNWVSLGRMVLVLFPPDGTCDFPKPLLDSVCSLSISQKMVYTKHINIHIVYER